MNTIFDLCQPRDDVLKGELKEEIFAARLRDVIEGKAEAIYQNPAKFFENTYPTQGMRTLLETAMGRLTGVKPTNNPILRLETAFGGGKTHNLIALYHVASGHARPEMVAELLPSQLIPRSGQIDVAGVVGSDLDPSSGLLHEANGIRTFTLWGELAYQLGGEAGYALAKASDLNRTAPGTGLLEQLVGEKPTLIMIDEIARHMRTAQGVPTATKKSNLAEQVVAFLMSLLEFAASRENVVVVLTLAGRDDAFGKENEALQRQLNEAGRVLARQEMVIVPTGETELSAIVNHRLFKHIDKARVDAVSNAYGKTYRDWIEQKVMLPDRALRAAFLQEMRESYPFHPDFLRVLSHRISTIPNFQRTRGALRLLALVVRDLWTRRPRNVHFIHAHHVNLANRQIVNDLTSRLNKSQFQQVVEADIVSTKQGALAHAQQIDEPWVASGKPPYARRAATAVFLHSLVQGMAAGIAPADLNLSVLEPGNDPLLLNKALDQLNDTCWFFEWDGHRYRFKTEPSLNKIISDEMDMVGRIAAKGELDRRLRTSIWKSGVFEVAVFPEEPGDVDDNAGPPKLVIMHYDAVSLESGDTKPPDLVSRIFQYSGALNAFRTYKNNLVFLVADEDMREHMVQQAQRYLAIQRILADVERLNEFSREQQRRLKQMAEAAELEVRVAITRAYRYLFYPSANAPVAQNHLAHQALPAQDQGDVRKDQSQVILRMLRQLGKALTGDDKPKSAVYVQSRVWDPHQTHMTTEDLRKAFAQRINLPMLMDPSQLKNTIRNGIETGVWVYYDALEGVGYDQNTPIPGIRLDDDAVLYLPEEAERLQLPIKGRKPPTPVDGDGIGGGETGPEERCPVCGNPVSQCTCGDDIVTVQTPLKGEGPVPQAFQKLVDACADQHVDALSRLIIKLVGTDRAGADKLRKMGLALPQLGRSRVKVQLDYTAGFGSGHYLTVKANLDERLYKRLKQATDNLAQDASELRVDLVLDAVYERLELAGEDFQTLREVLTTLDLGRIEVEGEAWKEASS